RARTACETSTPDTPPRVTIRRRWPRCSTRSPTRACPPERCSTQRAAGAQLRDDQIGAQAVGLAEPRADRVAGSPLEAGEHQPDGVLLDVDCARDRAEPPRGEHATERPQHGTEPSGPAHVVDDALELDGGVVDLVGV